MNPPPPASRCDSRPRLVGVLPGEGSGPELVDIACDVLDTVSKSCGLGFQVEMGGEIGCLASERSGQSLSEEVAGFCQRIFANGGVILAGAAGGRFVYDMRRRFKLYYKVNPLRSYPELRNVCRLKLPARPIDILLVRDNLQGLYQGDSAEATGRNGREVSHTFVHNEELVRAIIKVGATAARQRKKALAVIGKESGTPAVHQLWKACAFEVCPKFGVEVSMIEIDYAGYRLLQDPDSFDVIVAPNCFGDILSDLGGILAASRALTFGASYSANGAAVYQTNHGAAHDLANTDTANPAGQILSVAMMLRETFGLRAEAELIEEAIHSVWGNGWRTTDLIEPGCTIAGTRQFGALVTREILNAAVHNEACSAVG
ncbi:MAG TPA: isocitrate/isopropylmalate family dehydrogenase [Chthoniobacterales bacterium]|nr:isocitrate/isopropylmalate family dehydrogenase [Chthoniobacterales bacterium]